MVRSLPGAARFGPMRGTSFLGLIWIVACGLSCVTPAPPEPEPDLDLAPPPPAHVAKERPGLRLRVQPSDAAVLVDEKRRGTADQVGHGTGFLELRPGVHRISLERAGYETWRGEVTVGKKTELLEVRLETKE